MDRIDEGRFVPNQQQPEGFVGKYIKRPFNAIKSGIGTAGKWIWDHKKEILSTAGGGLEALGAITANPVIGGIGAGMRVISKGIQEGEAKKALEKATDEKKQQEQRENKIISFSDIPRMYYSRKPYTNPILNKGHELPNQIIIKHKKEEKKQVPDLIALMKKKEKKRKERKMNSFTMTLKKHLDCTKKVNN